MGLLLVGIVFLNVSLLGLNSGIAVTADQAADLRRQNADLRLEVAKLGSSERIQQVAESRGFVMPAPGEVTYLEADPNADGRTAARALGRAASVTVTRETPAVAGTAPEAPAVTGVPPEESAPETGAAVEETSPEASLPPATATSAPSVTGVAAPPVVGVAPE